MTDFILPHIDAAHLRNWTGIIIDVRRETVRLASGRQLVSSQWIDPLRLTHGHPVLQQDVPLAFICAHGHEISQFACALARLHGCEAVYMRGGFEACETAKLPLEDI